MEVAIAGKSGTAPKPIPARWKFVIAPTARLYPALLTGPSLRSMRARSSCYAERRSCMPRRQRTVRPACRLFVPSAEARCTRPPRKGRGAISASGSERPGSGTGSCRGISIGFAPPSPGHRTFRKWPGSTGNRRRETRTSCMRPARREPGVHRTRTRGGLGRWQVKGCVLVLMAIMTTGCSTIVTVGKGLEQDESFECVDGESIPRIYSGTHNSIRVLGERPLYLAPLILCDTLLSVVADTLFLGVTIPTQISRGNMCLTRYSTEGQSPRAGHTGGLVSAPPLEPGVE